MSSCVAPVLALVFNALVWGVSWWPLRQLQAMGVHPLWATSFIYGLAAAVVCLWRPQALGQLVRTPALWAIVAASGITNAAFNWAVGMGDVVRAVLLFYLMPLWSLVLARLLLREAVTAGAVLRAGLAVAGAALVLAGPGAGADAVAASDVRQPELLADLLAVLAGLGFALNTVLLRRGAALPGEGRSLAMFMGGAAVAGGAAAFFSAGLSPMVPGVAWPPVAAAWVGCVAGLALVFLSSNLCLQYGAARLSATVTALIMPCEVVFAAVTAVGWGGAVLHAGVIAGGGLILVAALSGLRGLQRAAA